MPPASQELDQLAEEAAAAERACDWDAAAELYRALFARAIEARAPERLPEALRGGTRVLHEPEATEEAEELASLSVEIAERHGLIQDVAEGLNLLATVLHRRNELVEARRLYGRALDRARDLGDDPLVAKTCLNLGVIDHTLGNLREARALYLESVSAGLRSGAPEHAMRAYNNLGMVCTDLEEWLEAQLHLERGIEIAERLDDAIMLAILHTNRIEPMVHLGEPERALVECNHADELARRVGNHSALADLGRFRAMIARAQGRLGQAETALGDALARAEEHDLDLCRAELLEELAVLRHHQGRDDEALAALEQAFDGFFALGAKRDVKRVGALLADWREASRRRIRIGAER